MELGVKSGKNLLKESEVGIRSQIIGKKLNKIGVKEEKKMKILLKSKVKFF